MNGIHRFSISVPMEIMKEVYKEVPNGEITAYIVTLIRKDLAKKARRDKARGVQLEWTTKTG